MSSRVQGNNIEKKSASDRIAAVVAVTSVIPIFHLIVSVLRSGFVPSSGLRHTTPGASEKRSVCCSTLRLYCLYKYFTEQ